MRRKSVEEKKRLYEERLQGSSEVIPFVNKTKLSKRITTKIKYDLYNFDYKEELLYYLSLLNPTLMRRFKEEQKEGLIINGLGLSVSIQEI